MSYITLGNLTRFLNKLKNYLSNNYLKLTGGTVTGDTIFRKKISAHEVCLAGLSDVSLVNKDNGSIALNGMTILDEGNYNLFTPTIHGTGATGTWDINISGNAVHDSNGNKIVDTYVKKSDIPTVSNITVDSALSAISTNPVQNKVIKSALDGKLSTEDNDLNCISYSNATISQLCSSTIANITLDAIGAKSTSAATLKLTGNGMEFTGTRPGHPNLSFNVSDSGVSFNGTLLLTRSIANTLYARINNGHLVINGSELWVE